MRGRGRPTFVITQDFAIFVMWGVLRLGSSFLRRRLVVSSPKRFVHTVKMAHSLYINETPAEVKNAKVGRVSFYENADSVGYSLDHTKHSQWPGNPDYVGGVERHLRYRLDYNVDVCRK